MVHIYFEKEIYEKLEKVATAHGMRIIDYVKKIVKEHLESLEKMGTEQVKPPDQPVQEQKEVKEVNVEELKQKVEELEKKYEQLSREVGRMEKDLATIINAFKPFYTRRSTSKPAYEPDTEEDY